jgi:hypothetical protein
MKSEKQKKGNNQTVILIAGSVILLLIVFAFLLMMKNKMDMASTPNVVSTGQPTTGQVTQRGNLMKVSDTIWTLVYDRPGMSAASLTVGMSDSTFCKKSGKPILCKQLQNGHRVDITGILENGTITAKEIDLLDEIRIEPSPEKSPQVQEPTPAPVDAPAPVNNSAPVNTSVPQK